MILAGLLLALVSLLFVSTNMLNITGGAQVASVAQGADVKLVFSDKQAHSPEASDIFVINGADGNDRGVKELIELMQRHGLSFYAKNNSSGIIGKNDVVIIKVNSQWDERGQTRFPALNIIDAIWVNANPGHGPSTSYSEATKTGVIVASTDPVALDYWAAKEILMPAARDKGYGDLSSIDPDNSSPGSFGNWLRRSMEEIRKAGYGATMDEDGMNIYIAK